MRLTFDQTLALHQVSFLSFMLFIFFHINFSNLMLPMFLDMFIRLTNLLIYFICRVFMLVGLGVNQPPPDPNVISLYQCNVSTGIRKNYSTLADCQSQTNQLGTTVSLQSIGYEISFFLISSLYSFSFFHVFFFLII